MKKKYKIPKLDHGLRDACSWVKVCAFIEDDEMCCDTCKAAETKQMTREKAQNWWKARIKELNKETT